MSAEEIMARMDKEPWGRFLLSMGYDPYNTESSARDVAEVAAERLKNHANAVICFDLARNMSSMSESVNTLAEYWGLATDAWKNNDRVNFSKVFFTATKLQGYGEQCWDRLLKMTSQEEWSDGY